MIQSDNHNNGGKVGGRSMIQSDNDNDGGKEIDD